MNVNLEQVKKHFYFYYKTHTRRNVLSGCGYPITSNHEDWMKVFDVNTDPSNQTCNQLKDKARKLFSQKEDNTGICWSDKWSIPYDTNICYEINKIYIKYQSTKNNDERKQKAMYIEKQKQEELQSRKKPITDPNNDNDDNNKSAENQPQENQKDNTADNQSLLLRMVNMEIDPCKFGKGFEYISDGQREIEFLDAWMNIYERYEKKYECMQKSVTIDNLKLRAEYLCRIDKEKQKQDQDNSQQFQKSFDQRLGESNQGKNLKFVVRNPQNDIDYYKYYDCMYSAVVTSVSFKKDVVLENCRKFKFGICESNISSNKNIAFKPLPNMDFELRNSDKLLYHHILKSQSVLLIVCSQKQINKFNWDNNKKTIYVTRAIVGRNGVLQTNSEAVYEWERILDLASYAETQQILALYDKSKQRIAFYSASNEKCDISRFMLDKNEINLNDYNWAVADENICNEYSIVHMIMDDATKRLILIDSNYCLRIYDLNTSNWYADEDETTALDLGISYNHCLITDEGAFLLAFKPGKDENDTINVTMTVVNLDAFEILKSDQSLPLQFKPENIHNFYLQKFTHNSGSRQGDEETTALVTVNTDPDEPHNSVLCVQSLDISVSSKKIRFHFESKPNVAGQSPKPVRKVTKLDYFQFMMDKFGSRAVFFNGGSDDYLELNTCLLLDSTSISKDKIVSKKEISQCQRVPANACEMVFDQCKKDFSLLKWNTNVVTVDWYDNESLSFDSITSANGVSFDSFVKNIIIQFPMQIARTSNGQFIIMHNGENNQGAYRKGCNDVYQWRNKISFGAYDAIISDWKGPIRVVSSMGKQSTGKSYALNHLFGSKFDTSGARCTDGAWMTVRICEGVDFDKNRPKNEQKEEDIMYIIIDFEGLCTFERTYQEDTMLAVFNASISNCTIFRCENSLGPELEEMFRRFQNGVNQFQGDETLFQGFLLMVIKDVPPGDKVTVRKEFISKLKQFVQRSEATNNNKLPRSFLTHMVRYFLMSISITFRCCILVLTFTLF